MFVIGEVKIDEEIADARFACDLTACQGACCTLPGGRGAPLREDEVARLESALPSVRKYLSPEHLELIARRGVAEGGDGDRTTTCIDDRACVFVFYEEGIARCSIEKSFLAGEIDWRKPFSCHLFPLRRSSGVSERMRYERIPECDPALRQGRRKDIALHDFLREALIRTYGDQWYQDFRKECRRRGRLHRSLRDFVERLAGGA